MRPPKRPLRIKRLSHADLVALIVLTDDRETRGPISTTAKLVRALARRELARREAVTDEANAIYRGLRS